MPVQWGTNPAVSQSVFLLRDVLAARPAAVPANQDYYFLATDASGGTLYQSTGSAWVQAAGPVLTTPGSALLQNNTNADAIPENVFGSEVPPDTLTLQEGTILSWSVGNPTVFLRSGLYLLTGDVYIDEDVSAVVGTINAALFFLGADFDWSTNHDSGQVDKANGEGTFLSLCRVTVGAIPANSLQLLVHTPVGTGTTHWGFDLTIARIAD